jgi:hypothetical protein
MKRREFIAGLGGAAVCAENLNPGVVVMESA